MRVDRIELLLGAATIAAALVMFLPGDPYAYGDKDPGVYVSHAFAIAREGDVVIPDRVLERVDDPELFSDGARYPGFWIEPEAPTSVTPQFFHLYPATAATAIDVVGPSGAWTLNPLLAALSTLAVVLAVRRAAGTLPAALTALLLVLSMPQVWQAKYTSTEILSQLLLAGAVFGAVVSLRTRWVGGVAAARARPSAPASSRARRHPLRAAGRCAVACALFALRWSDERVRWFLVGLPGDHPLRVVERLRAPRGVHAREHRADAQRARRRGGGDGRGGDRDPPAAPAPSRPPSWSRASSGGPAPRWWSSSAAVLLLAWFREDLFGIDYTYFGTRKIRSYDEPEPRVAVLVLRHQGAGRDVVRHRRDPAAPLARRPPLLVGPGLMLLPVYLYEAKISPRLMWWVRRFIPGIIPSMIVLIALFLAGRSTSGAGASGSWESSSPRC